MSLNKAFSSPSRVVSSSEIGCILNSRQFANGKVTLCYWKKQGNKKIFRPPPDQKVFSINHSMHVLDLINENTNVLTGTVIKIAKVNNSLESR